MHIDKIIERIQKLDLSTYPVEEIRFLMNQVGPMAHMFVSYHRGKSLMRARPNYENEEFRTKKEFSYKPQALNDKYQRASTPFKTMFYATTVADMLEPGESANMRVIGMVETIPFLRDSKIEKGYQKISFGRWEVNEDINLLAIIHKGSFHGENGFIRMLFNDYTKNLALEQPEIREKSEKFCRFLAEEFGKDNISNDYDYLISAIYSEMAIKKGLEGILYPSVRAGGQGFNVALTPEATKKLKLVVAGECSAVKFNGTTYLGNDAIVELSGEEADDEIFEMKPLNEGLNRILKQIGISDVNQLIP
jgi:hypothetical protein